MIFYSIGGVAVRKDAILTLQMFNNDDEHFIEIGLINGRYIKSKCGDEHRVKKEFDILIERLEES